MWRKRWFWPLPNAAARTRRRTRLPDLLAPGAAGAGDVECVHCGERVASGDADLVGRGHRCRRCTIAVEVAEAEGHPDLVDHLTFDERRQRVTSARRRTRSWTLAALSLGTGGIAVAIAIAGWPLLVGVVSTVGYALLKRSQARTELRRLLAAEPVLPVATVRVLPPGR